MTKQTFPVLFLDDVVVLPDMVVPLEITSEIQAILDAARAGRTDKSDNLRLLLVPRIDGSSGSMGTAAEVTQIGRLPTARQPSCSAVPTAPGSAPESADPARPSGSRPTCSRSRRPPSAPRELAAEFKQVVTSILQQRTAWQVIDAVQKLNEPSELADAAGYATWIDIDVKLQLLELVDVEERLELLVERGRTHLAELEVAERIRDDVREGMDKTQREYLLRQQLAAIRKELGEGEAEDGGDYRSRIEAADLPEAVREAALREADKLERTSDASPETGWIRTWLDTVLELPWGVSTDDTTDIEEARRILDADHTGLEDVKDRIIEYLAVRARRASRGLEVAGGRGSGAVLALAGPPGVGKTSLGESVARALGRNFVRVALGGVRDEAEIRGHRRTYVGALPGRIVRAIKESGSMNPVVLLDEIDKVGADYRGDPAAALLEVLDPAQNHTFRDHYLELDLDLSNVMFLATANVIETIPEPLLDRMELVRLDGYTEEEKVAIARDHLLPRQRERAGLTEDEVAIDDEALRVVAADHTREAGVRQLERAMAKILRKVATELAKTDDDVSMVHRDGAADVSHATWVARASCPRSASGLRCQVSPPGWP